VLHLVDDADLPLLGFKLAQVLDVLPGTVDVVLDLFDGPLLFPRRKAFLGRGAFRRRLWGGAEGTGQRARAGPEDLSTA
jgi:hypothetical protein